jgi:hypothetical protein
MNFFMPPKASMAASVIVAGFDPVTIMRSDFAAASQVSVRISRDAGIEKTIPAMAAVFKNSPRPFPPSANLTANN